MGQGAGGVFASVTSLGLGKLNRPKMGASNPLYNGGHLSPKASLDSRVSYDNLHMLEKASPASDGKPGDANAPAYIAIFACVFCASSSHQPARARARAQPPPPPPPPPPPLPPSLQPTNRPTDQTRRAPSR